MKQTLTILFLLISTVSFANIAQEAREMADEGGGSILGIILAALFGYAVSYPILFFSFYLRFAFSKNTPIFEKSKQMTSLESEHFVLCFLALFVFILPFVSVLPVVIFYDWFAKQSMFKIYVIYTAVAVVISTIYTVYKSDITKCK